MRKLLTIAVLLATGSAFAAISILTNNVVGVMRVDSSEKQTVVAIPWVGFGVGDTDIRVTDVVRTATLAEGDQLFAYVKQEWKCWMLTGGKWEAAQVVSSSSSLPSAGVPAADQAMKRGEAVILVRKTPSSNFFVQGRVSADATTVIETLPANTASLIAPPSTAATDLNDTNAVEWDFGAEDHTGDRIKYKDDEAKTIRFAKFIDDKWRAYDADKRSWTDEVVIPAGQGAWYQNNAKGNVTVIWKNGTHL